METIFMSTKNCKTEERHRFRVTKADKDPTENMALADLSIYYSWINSLYIITLNLKSLVQLLNSRLFLVCY